MARLPLVLNLSGLRIAFPSYTEFSEAIGSSKRPGAPAAKLPSMVEDIRRTAANNDIVVVSLHMDPEFYAYPSLTKRKFCFAAIDNGAHLVLCHHPHVPQGIELYKKGLIAYSLGNFLFNIDNDYFVRNNADMVRKSFILKVLLNQHGVYCASIIPILIGHDCNVSIMNERQAANFGAYMNIISTELQDNRYYQRWYETGCSFLKKEVFDALYKTVRTKNPLDLYGFLRGCRKYWLLDTLSCALKRS